MTTYYLIHNDNLVGTIEADTPGFVALGLLRTTEAMSLMDSRHVDNLMTNLSLTPAEALAALGIVDTRASAIKALLVAPQIVSLQTVVDGPAYKLADVGAYSIYQVDAAQANLLAIHNELYAMSPASTLGLLAVVSVFGTSFYPSAVRTAIGQTAAQAIARRDRIAAYLESIGKTNTTALRAATDEGAQIAGIATALGVDMSAVWAAMVE